MEALSEDGGRVALNADRCIGCGLCVSTCPSGALTLERKSESELTRVPATFQDTWRIIETLVYDCLRYESRIETIESIKVEADPYHRDTVLINVAVRLVDERTPLRATFPLFLEAAR